ncbi:MAG TPA: hypothetical protein VGB70_14285 [Allosphingosinicella sp.]|jgi:hypothetical protein
MARSSIPFRGSTVDYALAGAAGLAFAFAAFALPEWRLTQLALGSGLADIFPPARPPLGFTARLLFAGAIGAIALVGSYLLLRLAERPRIAKRESTEADVPPEPIRLRRADAHPDAPPRRPLAARDLGEPIAEPAPAEELLLAPETEAPAFLVAQEPETVEAEPVEADAEPEAPLVWPPEVAAEDAPPPEPEPPIEAREAAPEPASVEPEAEPSITKLMQRLEFGLAKKERVVLDPAAVAAPAEDAVGHRLRSAIGDLQKLAARG